mmetsp:Transcript_2397/g.4141  ORF Transcript_2397/g.4141 Transcript_2397/m.4141 type:complete len:139 (+) Transcript_2397:277-693(+)
MHNLARTKPKAQTDWLSHPSIHPFINQSTNPLARLGGNVSALCREERLFAKELLTDFDWFVGPSIDWAEEGFPSASRPVTAHANANAATAATTITAAATKLCAAADPQPSWAPLGWRPLRLRRRNRHQSSPIVHHRHH